MKIIYLETKRKLKEAINIDTSKLPKELFLAYSIQYKSTAEELKKQLSQKGIAIKGFKQVLGCTKLKSHYPILLIGSGRFHALNLAIQNKDVYIYNSSVVKIEGKELENLKKSKISAINRFLNSSTIGILISTKPGQENLKRAEQLKSIIAKKYPEKQVYLLISNTISLAELENFNLDFFINSACPGLLNDSNKIANIDDIFEFL